MKKNLAHCLAVTAVMIGLAACATAPVIPMGNDTYMISQTSAGGMFRSMSSLKAEVMQRANDFAASKGKVAVALASHEAPAYPGHMPAFDYQFLVVDKNDPRAEDNSLVPRADVVVENHITPPGQAAPIVTNGDVYTKLIQLDDLRKRGIITETEFEAQKQKLLSER